LKVAAPRVKQSSILVPRSSTIFASVRIEPRSISADPYGYPCQQKGYGAGSGSYQAPTENPVATGPGAVPEATPFPIHAVTNLGDQL
jgi:hypothetical protein